MWQVDYSKHPGFSGFLERETSDRLLELLEMSNRLILQLQWRALEGGDFSNGLQKLNQLIESLFAACCDKNTERIFGFSTFVTALKEDLKEVVRLELQDLCVRVQGGMPLANQLELASHSKLRSQGFVTGSIGLQKAQELNVKLDPLKQEILNRYALGEHSRERLSISSVPGLLCKQLTEWFAEDGLIQALSAYKGYPVRVHGFALEMSSPSANWWHTSYPDYPGYEPQTHYFHWDQSRERPKVLMYLGDTDDDNGPFEFLPSESETPLPPLQWMLARVMGCQNLGAELEQELSRTSVGEYLRPMRSTVYRRIFYGLPQCLRLNGHFGWDILPGSDLEKAVLDKRIVLKGTSGDYICFDGARVLHRGGVNCKRPRWGLQIIISKVPGV